MQSTSGLDAQVLGISFIIASLVVMLGWFVMLAFTVVFLNRKVAAMEAGAPHQEPPPSALLFYGLSFFFWPAALVGALQFFKEPRTARQGRNCALMGLANVSVVVVLTCLACAALGVVGMVD